jgi:hypothetical protein
VQHFSFIIYIHIFPLFLLGIAAIVTAPPPPPLPVEPVQEQIEADTLKLSSPSDLRTDTSSAGESKTVNQNEEEDNDGEEPLPAHPTSETCEVEEKVKEIEEIDNEFVTLDGTAENSESKSPEATASEANTEDNWEISINVNEVTLNKEAGVTRKNHNMKVENLITDNSGNHEQQLTPAAVAVKQQEEVSKQSSSGANEATGASDAPETPAVDNAGSRGETTTEIRAVTSDDPTVPTSNISEVVSLSGSASGGVGKRGRSSSMDKKGKKNRNKKVKRAATRSLPTQPSAGPSEEPAEGGEPPTPTSTQNKGKDDPVRSPSMETSAGSSTADPGAGGGKPPTALTDLKVDMDDEEWQNKTHYFPDLVTDSFQNELKNFVRHQQG